MTDKEIAMAWLCRKLWAMSGGFDHGELEMVAGQQLSSKRYDRVCINIGKLIDQIREPLAEELRGKEIKTT